MELSKKVPVLYLNGKRFDEECILSVELARGYITVKIKNMKTHQTDIVTFSYDEVEIEMETREEGRKSNG